jgi:heat shock protein HslJ
MITFLSIFMACGDKVSDTAVPSDTASVSPSSILTDKNLILSSHEGFRQVSEEIRFSTDERDGFSYSGSCNSFSGTYTLDNDVFVVNDLSGTEIGCDTTFADEDSWLTDFFTNAPNWSYENDVLVFSNSESILEFRDPPEIVDASVVGTNWLIDGFITGDAITSINLTTTPTINFQSDGGLSLNTGCNQGVGGYQLNASTIGVSIDNYSEAICPDSAAQDAERHIVNVFMTLELAFTVEGNKLTLMNEDIGITATAEQ